MHLLHKKTRCVGIALATLILCTACNAVPLSNRRIVKALFFEKTKAECMVTLLLQKQNEDSDAVVFGRGKSFAEALYSAQNKLEGKVFYGTIEIATFPYESTWAQVETIGELLYDKVAPIPEISIFQLDKPIEQGNETLYEKKYEKMKEAEVDYKFHWGLESVFAEDTECILPLLQEDGYNCVIIRKQGSDNIFIQSSLEAQIIAVLNGHGSKINAEPSGIDSSIEADAHIEHSRSQDGAKLTLVLDNVRWTALQDAPHDIAVQDEELINEIKGIYASNRRFFDAQNIDPFHIDFFSELYGANKSRASFAVILNDEKS